MANGKIRFGKQSGGELALVIPDGVANTEVIIPESGELVNKDYADLKVALADFIGTNVNLANSGYQKLPSGLIIQWGSSGTVTVSAGSNTAADGAFPISFPNVFLSITCSAVAVQAGIFSNCTGISLTHFVGVIGNTSTTAYTGKYNFIAIGY